MFPRALCWAILFNIFIDDLLRIGGNIVAFADDTVILVSESSWLQSTEEANTIVNKASDWLNQNLLTINVDKSSFITFSMGRDMIPDDVNIAIYDGNTYCPLQRTNSSKYLGIIIDQHLQWNEHIISLLKKTKYILLLFHKLKYYSNYKKIKTIYYAVFNSHTSYGILGWESSNKILIII